MTSLIEGVMLMKSGGAAALPDWQAQFARVCPTLDVRGWDDPDVDPDRVTYVFVWEPEPGRLARYRNLRVIFSSAAGVDHLTRDPHLPRHVPIVRMGADEAAQTMGEYVCLAALALLRDYRRIVAAQAERRWDPFDAPRTAAQTRVGILGLGNLGRRAAAMLQGLGFSVAGWTRSPRQEPSVPVAAGLDALPGFLAGADILVGLLPDTPETAGLIDAARIACLPPGAGIINAGRGSLIVMNDLIAALDWGISPPRYSMFSIPNRCRNRIPHGRIHASGSPATLPASPPGRPAPLTWPRPSPPTPKDARCPTSTSPTAATDPRAMAQRRASPPPLLPASPPAQTPPRPAERPP